MDMVKVKINGIEVEVPAGKKTVDFGGKVTFVTEDIKSDANYKISDAVEAAGFAAKYADGEDVDLSGIEWTSAPDYDNTKDGKYIITGEWSDIYGNSQTLTIEINIVLAGATGIKLYTSGTSKNPIGSTGITMETLETKRIYAGLEPIGVTDTITWTIDKTNYAEVSSTSGATATIKAKSIGNVSVTLTATTGSGKSVSIKIVINAKQNQYNGNGYYVSGNGSGNSLNLLAQDAENLAQQQIANGSVFADLVGYEWASTQVETLRLLGVVSGKSNVAFAPADSVTRAEYLAMLVRLFNLQVVGEAKTFTDVPADAWYYNAVSIASSNGIAYGYENGAFDPNAVISRQDMAVFAERAVKAVGLNPMLGLERTFSDQAQISGYAVDAVLYMTAIGAINGMGDDTFAPNDTANRAQAAVVIYNLYALKNQ